MHYRALAPCGRGLRQRCNMRCWVRGCGPDPSPVCGLCEAEQPSPARGEGGRGCAAIGRNLARRVATSSLSETSAASFP
jgi:hypothetical protein